MKYTFPPQTLLI